MRILLTGAAGFLGSHVAEALLARGDEVLGLDSFDPFYDPALKLQNVSELERWPGWFLERGDIRDADLVRRLLSAGDVNAIVHLAARAGVRPSIEDPATHADVNVRGTTVVLDAARRAGVRRVVCASSSSVYGASAAVPFRTDSPAETPVSPYAATKRAGELMAEAFAHLHGLSVVSLRYFTVYGPRQRPDMAISKFIRLIDAGQPVPRFGDGSSRRDYTYVDDAVAGTLGALRLTETAGPGHRIYNIGEATTISLNELIASIGRAVGKAPVIEEMADQPGDVPATHADLETSLRDLSYKPSVDIDEGIRRQVAWWRRPGARPARRGTDGRDGDST